MQLLTASEQRHADVRRRGEEIRLFCIVDGNAVAAGLQRVRVLVDQQGRMRIGR